MERVQAFLDNRFEPGGSHKVAGAPFVLNGDPVSDQFGCVPPEAFRIFAKSFTGLSPTSPP